MGLQQLLSFELICDSQKSGRCAGTQLAHPTVQAYTLKNARALPAKHGWKVNAGKRGGEPTFICPACQVAK